MEAFRKIYPSEFYKKFLIHGVRPDGRDLYRVRKTKISVGSLGGADGSSFVRLGTSANGVGEGTSVSCGIVGELGPPTESTPNGQIVVNVELTPLCSTRFRGGKPSELAQSLGEFLNRLLNNPSVVSFAKTKVDITRDKNQSQQDQNDDNEEEDSIPSMVWYLHADIYCLNYDGNVLDACLIALLAALNNVRLPKMRLTKDNQLVVIPLEEQPTDYGVELLHYPIPLSFSFTEEYLIADPTSEEEDLSNGHLTIVYSSSGKLCSIIKGGGLALSDDKLKECIQLAKNRTEEITNTLKSK